MNQNKNKTGIILAAGLGSRFNKSGPTIKPLIDLGGIPLLIRTLHSLEIAGCKNIVIVLGCQAQTIEKLVRAQYNGPLELIFAFNQNYELQNGLSVLTARPFIKDEFILTMADHLMDDKIMRLISNHRHPLGGATLCVDYKLGTIFDIDDATKVLTKNSLIKKIGKMIKNFNCIDTGIFIGSNGLMDAINQVYQEKGDASLSEGVQLLADKGLMEALDIKDAFWQDVDNREMLKHAETILRDHSNN